MTRVTLLLLSSAAVLAAPAIAIAASSNAPTAGTNRVYLNQADDGNRATISQSGSGNIAGPSDAERLSQSGGTGSGNNVLDIVQTGTGGVIGGSAFDAVGGVQRGSSNQLTINQGGMGNRASYQQYGANPNTLPTATALPSGDIPASGWNSIEQNSGSQGGGSNRVRLLQGRDTDPRSNVAAIIKQTQSRNDLYLNQQTGTNSATFAQQIGTGGRIEFAQTYNEQVVGGGFANNYNYAELRQSGTSNIMAPDQQGANDRQFLTQAGTGNFLFDRQNAWRSTITVKQNGEGSNIFAVQGATFNAARPSGYTDFSVNPPLAGNGYAGTASLAPSSTVNSSLNVDQFAVSSTVGFGQVGVGQTAMLTQRGANNGMYGMQDGSGQLATMIQSGGSDNNMFLTQTGSMSTATLVQDGGMMNLIIATQTGSGQRADIAQGAVNGNVSNTVQSGSNNSVTVRQNHL